MNENFSALAKEITETFKEPEILHTVLDEFYQSWILTEHFSGMTKEAMMNYTNAFIMLKKIVRCAEKYRE